MGLTENEPHDFLRRKTFQDRISWDTKTYGDLIHVDETLLRRRFSSVYRYVPIVEADSIVRNKVWWFDKPTCWPDKYESYVARELFGENAPFGNMGVYAKCFTFHHSSEPIWQLSKGRVRLRFTLDKLIRSLSSAKRTDEGPLPKLFIGRARYMDPWVVRDTIDHLKLSRPKAVSRGAVPALLMKRIGFNYENEIRACFVFGEGSIGDARHLEIEVDDNAINQMMTNPYADPPKTQQKKVEPNLTTDEVEVRYKDLMKNFAIERSRFNSDI